MVTVINRNLGSIWVAQSAVRLSYFPGRAVARLFRLLFLGRSGLCESPKSILAGTGPMEAHII